LTNVSILFPVGNKVIVVLWKYWFTSLNCAQTTFFTAKQVKNVVIELKWNLLRLGITMLYRVL